LIAEPAKREPATYSKPGFGQFDYLPAVSSKMCSPGSKNHCN
jgi:hypothetical protein